MRMLLDFGATFFLLPGFVTSQGNRNCEAFTFVNLPSIAVFAPIAWSADGTVQDMGTINWQCPRPGCTPKACEHNVKASVWVTFPGAAPPPGPGVNVDLGEDGTPIGSFPVGVTGITANPDGTFTATFDLGRIKFFTACEISAMGGVGFKELSSDFRFHPPGGGADITSGGATLPCSNC